MTFQFFDTVALTRLINAFVFAGIILSKTPRTSANSLLSAILGVLGLLCAKILLHTLGLWQLPSFRYFPLGINLLLQPLLFLYTLALTEPKRLEGKLLVKHLALPFFLGLHAVVVYFCTVFVENEPEKRQIANALAYDALKLVEDILSIRLGVLYGSGYCK